MHIKKLLSTVCVWLLFVHPFVSAVDTLTGAIPNNESEFWPEFLQALSFAYETWLTKFKTVNTFKPYDKITREQTASMMWKFAYSVLDFDLDTTKDCDFKDIWDVDTTLYSKVMMSCHTGLFHWTSDHFLFPKRELSKAEWITVLMRMFRWESLDENVEPRYKNYYEEAKKIWLTKEPKVESLDRPMTRYETILLLYRFNVKYELLNLVNNSSDSDWQAFGINMLSDDIVYIDSQSFLNEDVDQVYAKIFGTTYRLEKSNLVSQFDNALTRYGNVFTDIKQIDGSYIEEYIWVATFNLVNDIMTDGNIRPIELGDDYFSLHVSDVKPFYEIKEVKVSKNENDLQPTTSDTAVEWQLQNQEWETIYNPGYVEWDDNAFTE